MTTCFVKELEINGSIVKVSKELDEFSKVFKYRAYIIKNSNYCIVLCERFSAISLNYAKNLAISRGLI